MNKRLEQLAEALNGNFRAPEVYMFKFIVPGSNESIARALALFDENSVVDTKSSTSGNYMAITARETMFSVDAILEKYKLAFQIDGLIAL